MFLRNKHQILLWSGSWQEESSEITFKLLGLRSGFIFAPVYQPDCSKVHGGDLHCCGWRGDVLDEPEPESLLSVELSQRPTWIQTNLLSAHEFTDIVQWSNEVSNVTFSLVLKLQRQVTQDKLKNLTMYVTRLELFLGKFNAGMQKPKTSPDSLFKLRHLLFYMNHI